MAEVNHYDTLELSPLASQAEIKQAYRRLAKQFHPDTNPDASGHDRIAKINAAYEVLSDPRQRQSYDRHLSYGQAVHFDPHAETQRHQRAAAAQREYQKRQTGRDSDAELQLWLKRVYQPVNRMLNRILSSLQDQIDDLAADPFDDELLEEFQDYLENCRQELQQAQRLFRSLPNPPNVAGVAAHLYYCLNQVGDGLDELERFISSYDDHYLHTGQELFRIAKGLKREAQTAVREVTR
ncbi:DnaJ domain-containing protein [Leptolyngbya sp. FACHB-711]|uniref:J domain-containing protein n=1 Tax=unclassified Leptolyngbya TaxID=2650499 RepID=UPI0016891E9D|nr:DnaJ domain-containing protein [Leptolyngbya sp. FACHB-711]MBD1849525.1 J domain-containing protein [Cyanobacteria bacterium FACHB-502]MBD2022960.1 J domain-containing protein [Leptolyngbya sp. FACHB-711]